jgi:hypothetical protein
MAFTSESSFYVPHLPRHRISASKVKAERHMILNLNTVPLDKGGITIYFKRLRLDAADVMSGTRTYDLLDAKREHYLLATATSKCLVVLSFCIREIIA